ncbi:hypothetical protein [uncultured Acetatifactor sp.]|jgi:cobalamin biosynthesis Mg chelatase CobN|uniref:hypothetical protein n=1 Tax=uncultured Acetatifactor sp. TaxID=1671927 RepID=UPI00263101EA|nr:hypothetical protein [uncultured Acetatifactor sp.]MCI8695831.1 hypothetical protein [Lachnospiraceae bacterium]MCI9651209.1 hypothetical protein [Lachnospiraceae bacterium]
MKNTGNRKGFKGFAAALAAVLLAASLSHTALADGDFSGDITVKNVVAGYEYKVYEVLDCIAAGGETSVYMATEEWKDFLETNENAIAMLTPTEYESGMTDADSKVYTVNMESDKAARKAFAADALQYAQENGIEPTETRTAQDGERDVAFLGLNLGIHVVDTAGRARVVVMWDMGWESEITESYEPEADTGTETAAAGTESTAENSAESAEKAMIQAAAGEAPEESGATEDGADAEKESMESTEPESAEEAAEENSSAPVVIIMAAVAVLAVAAGIVYMKRKR